MFSCTYKERHPWFDINHGLVKGVIGDLIIVFTIIDAILLQILLRENMMDIDVLLNQGLDIIQAAN